MNHEQLVQYGFKFGKKWTSCSALHDDRRIEDIAPGTA